MTSILLQREKVQYPSHITSVFSAMKGSVYSEKNQSKNVLSDEKKSYCS